MADETEMLSARIPSELKDLVDADSRTNQDVVKSALWSEFGGERMGELETRIDEKETRINVVQNEINSRDNELQELRKELNALREKYEEMQTEEAELLQEARETLEPGQFYPENPAVENWADKLDMSPEELIEELEGGSDE